MKKTTSTALNKKSFRAGYVAIVGRANVGKSSLLNALIGQKIAAVSAKPQTTRLAVRGVLSTPKGQALLLDTPGFLKDARPLERWMRGQISTSLREADLVCWMIEAAGLKDKDLEIQKLIKKVSKPTFLLVNKMDRVKKAQVLPLLDQLQKEHNFLEIIPMSVRNRDNLDCLVSCLFQHLPLHAPYVDLDIASTHTEREIVAELIREKIYLFMEEEIPYATTVHIDVFLETDPVTIEASLIVERESQKGMLIGKNADKVREITQAAKRDIEDFLQKSVQLKLWVKVVENWKEQFIQSKESESNEI